MTTDPFMQAILFESAQRLANGVGLIGAIRLIDDKCGNKIAPPKIRMPFDQSQLDPGCLRQALEAGLYSLAIGAVGRGYQ